MIKYCDEKLAPRPLLPFWKNRGSNAPALRVSLRVTENYTIITSILNAVAHLQLEVCKSSQDLVKHPTNKNHHSYFQNHIKSISTWSLSNNQRSNNFLNIRSVVVTTNCYGLSLPGLPDFFLAYGQNPEKNDQNGCFLKKLWPNHKMF